MIVCVSIVDKHRPEGDRHVGTYTFEIDYPAAVHPGQMDFKVFDVPGDLEKFAHRDKLIGRLAQKDEMVRFDDG